MDLLTGLVIVVVALVAVGGLAAVLHLHPLPSAADDLARRVTDLGVRQDALEARWHAVQEGLDETLETVERKRRRTAASASKMNGASGEQQPPDPLTEARNRLMGTGPDGSWRI